MSADSYFGRPCMLSPGLTQQVELPQQAPLGRRGHESDGRPVPVLGIVAAFRASKMLRKRVTFRNDP